MKRLNYIFSLLLFQLCFFSIVSAQNESLTLEKSIEIGLQNNREIKISKSKLVSSEARLKETTSSLLPQFKLSGGYTRLSEVPEFAIQLPGRTIQISPVILNSYSLRATLQQPIFTGFKLNSIRSAAKLNNAATELEYNQSLNETAFKIHVAFWQLYKAEKYLKLINENLNSISNHLEDTKNFLENGLATQNDFLKLQVQYSNLELQKIEAATNLETARMNFNSVLNLPIEQKTSIKVDQIDFETSELKFEKVINEALKNRNEIEAMQKRVEANSKFVSAAKSNYFPQVFLSANYNYARPNQRIFPLQDKFDDTWDVSVNFSWELFNWGGTSSQVEQARQNKIQSELNLSQLKDAVEIEVSRNFNIMKSALQKVEVSRKTVEQAEENFRITDEKYKIQLATSTDLIDAENLLLQAKINYSNSIADYKLAKAQLEKSMARKIY